MATLKTGCGKELVVTERTQKHLETHPEAGTLLAEAVSKITIPTDGGFLLVEVDMGRVIGKSALVVATMIGPDEETLFACRKGRDVPSRIRNDIERPDTNLFTVIAGVHEGAWTLFTGFNGPSAAKEPHDDTLAGGNEKELVFWCTHALVWDEGWDAPFTSTWRKVLDQVAKKRATEPKQ